MGEWINIKLAPEKFYGYVLTHPGRFGVKKLTKTAIYNLIPQAKNISVLNFYDKHYNISLKEYIIHFIIPHGKKYDEFMCNFLSVFVEIS